MLENQKNAPDGQKNEDFQQKSTKLDTKMATIDLLSHKKTS